MSYKPGDAYTGEFTTCNASTGAAVNADSLPTATAAHNGTDDGSFTLTVTNVATGRYKVTGTIPSSYASGDAVQVAVSATVNSVAGVAITDSFVLDGVRLSDVTNGNNQVASNLVAINGGAASSTSTVQIDMTQTVPTTNTGQTVGDALNAARAQGFGKWTISGTTLTLYAADGTTVVRTFTLDSSSSPTQRV